MNDHKIVGDWVFFSAFLPEILDKPYVVTNRNDSNEIASLIKHCGVKKIVTFSSNFLKNFVETRTNDLCYSNEIHLNEMSHGFELSDESDSSTAASLTYFEDEGSFSIQPILKFTQQLRIVIIKNTRNP